LFLFHHAFSRSTFSAFEERTTWRHLRFPNRFRVSIQGEFVEIGALPVGRGFRYGDGVFETIRVEHGQPYNLEFHLNRLFRGCEAMYIEIDCDVFDIIDQLLPYNKVGSGFVKVIISRDSESKGYLPLSNKSRVLVETTEGIAEVKQPATYCISEFKAQRVVNTKTLSSLHYVMSLLEATRNKFDNSLLLNDAGKICEFASGNIFWLKGGTLFTPSEEFPDICWSMVPEASDPPSSTVIVVLIASEFGWMLIFAPLIADSALALRN
jgi:branched-subunit amino acid aminotransferase/4-amino-4-deoxychorismate lyase